MSLTVVLAPDRKVTGRSSSSDQTVILLFSENGFACALRRPMASTSAVMPRHSAYFPTSLKWRLPVRQPKRRKPPKPDRTARRKEQEKRGERV